MRVLVTAATEKEIEPFLATGPATEFLVSGAGVPSTLYALTKKLAKEKYDLVIQAGIAGSFEAADIGNVFFVERDCFADLGMQENTGLMSLKEAGLSNEDEWLINPYCMNYPAASAVTVNLVSGNAEQNRMIFEKYAPRLESMEGAAFHYVCLKENVPFAQLRCVSNRVGERNKENWNFSLAIQNLNDALIHFTATLP